MDNIIVLTQNLKLSSLVALKPKMKGESTLIFSTQFIFENERALINHCLGSSCLFLNFSDILFDADFDVCDSNAYHDDCTSLSMYYDEIKRLKNLLAIKRIEEKYSCKNKYIVCDDLGIDRDSWIKSGYTYFQLKYYHVPDVVKSEGIRGLLSKFIKVVQLIKGRLIVPISEITFNGKKYLFYGSLNRIRYRIDSEIKKASFIENLIYSALPILIKFFNWTPRSNVIRMSTLHESVKYNIPSHPNLNKVLIQDGYLPPNYPSKYLLFNGKYTEYYTWDILGQLIFKYHGLKSKPMPFRKKLYLPEPAFPKQIKKILCVASGAGDWTAVKNRSDEDKMIYAFGKVAVRFPEIEFIYRCHPVWVHPQHQGVHSIVRAAEYIEYLNLPNFKISCNIPTATDEKGNFILSYKRSSFEDDLKDVDIVFGEHSVSMIDAAFKKILFGSVNVTGRRNFFEGVTKLGFPHCETIEEITNLIFSLTTSDFKESYIKAINNYNIMTDQEC